MTDALAHNQQAVTRDSTSTGTQARYNNWMLDKKLPHAALSGCNQPNEACNPVGIHQMAQPSTQEHQEKSNNPRRSHCDFSI